MIEQRNRIKANKLKSSSTGPNGMGMSSPRGYVPALASQGHAVARLDVGRLHLGAPDTSPAPWDIHRRLNPVSKDK